MRKEFRIENLRWVPYSDTDTTRNERRRETCLQGGNGMNCM